MVEDFDEFDDFDYRNNEFGDDDDSQEQDDNRSEEEKLKDSIKDALDSIDRGDKGGQEQEGDDSGANWDDGNDGESGEQRQRRNARGKRLEDLKNAFNDWIRTSNEFDFCIDFDKALCDSKNDKRAFKPKYDSGDHLHPSELAYKKMAEIIPLHLL